MNVLTMFMSQLSRRQKHWLLIGFLGWLVLLVGLEWTIFHTKRNLAQIQQLTSQVQAMSQEIGSVSTQPLNADNIRTSLISAGVAAEQLQVQPETDHLSVSIAVLDANAFLRWYSAWAPSIATKSAKPLIELDRVADAPGMISAQLNLPLL
jgi:type II secretory pathway component PulM